MGCKYNFCGVLNSPLINHNDLYRVIEEYIFMNIVDI
jgi:hypothetical protein